MTESRYPKVAQIKTTDQLRERLRELAIEIPVDDSLLRAEESPLAHPIQIGEFTVGNRWCIHPMEGWDANADGSPSDLTLRRWRNFGTSGAKLIWGGEAAAVQPDGRANPRQTMASADNEEGLRCLRETLVDAHQQSFGKADDLLVGLQLTHSGRFCRPNTKQLEPRIAYHNPLLDEKFHIAPDDQAVVLTDHEIEQLIENYVVAAKVAQVAGFQFVDIKACHGYLLHEFLSARPRPGKFGGDYEGRTRLLKTIVSRVLNEIPGLMVGVRLSVFDMPPFRTSREVGEPMAFQRWQPYPFCFGADAEDPLNFDLTEPIQLIRELRELGVVALNVSAGSPYYNPHMQRPAIFPPSDGYLPPEDPLVGVARQLQAARICKAAVPEMPMVGSGYSYLQDYLPQVGQALVRENWIDMIGLGRMVLSYPNMPADVLEKASLQRKKVCRTFSDCTTAPRNGMVSGCFPLDQAYKAMPEADELRTLKRALQDPQ